MCSMEYDMDMGIMMPHCFGYLKLARRVQHLLICLFTTNVSRLSVKYRCNVIQDIWLVVYYIVQNTSPVGQVTEGVSVQIMEVLPHNFKSPTYCILARIRAEHFQPD